MEKVTSQFSWSLMIWQFIAITMQVAIIILLYKIFMFLKKYFKNK